MEDLSDYDLENIIENLDINSLDSLVLTNKKIRLLPLVQKKLEINKRWKEEIFRLFGTKIENGQVVMVQSMSPEDDEFSIEDTKKILTLTPKKVENYIQVLKNFIDELNNFQFSDDDFNFYVGAIEENQSNWPQRIFDWNKSTHKITMNEKILRDYPISTAAAFFALDNGMMNEMPRNPYFGDFIDF